MNCSNCGTEIKEGTGFCENCGAPVTLNQNIDVQPLIQNQKNNNKRRKLINKKILIASIVIGAALILTLEAFILCRFIKVETIKNTGSEKIKNKIDEFYQEFHAESIETTIVQEQKHSLSKESVSEEGALEIARENAGKKYTEFGLMCCGKDVINGRTFYVIEVFEDHPDHIAALAWYCVDTEDGKTYEQDMISNKLIPLN